MGELPAEALQSLERMALVNACRHGGRAELGAVLGGVLGEFPDLRGSADKVAKEARGVIQRVNSMAPQEQLAALEAKYPGSLKQHEREGREGLPPLHNAVKGKACFRLPPEPSGFMTIGHAMAFSINYLYKEEYSGELWLRFEDTNPKKAARRYYDSFRRGIAWLGITCDHEKNISDDIDRIYSYGRRMVEKGEAYACSCEPSRAKSLRFEGRPCEHRDRPAGESLALWQEMVDKRHKEGTLVIRLKGEMGSADPSLRDPNLFRIIDHPHPLTGDRYTLWPTYNLANAVEDEICGVTHILRSSEFQSGLQELLRSRLGFRPVEVIQFSRFNFKGAPVKKRVLRPLVEEGVVSGWDDPRMPTVDGVRRRGIVPEAIRQFTLQVGYTKTEHEYDWSLLYAVNRKLLDPVSKRLFFVPDPVEITVDGAPDVEAVIPYHPERDLGTRSIATSGRFRVPRADLAQLKDGEVFRLMDLYNVRVRSSGGGVRAEYAGDEIQREGRKVQWTADGGVPVKVLVAGLLFDDAGKVDPSSLAEVSGVAEPSFSQLAVGDIVQFPRFGFCRLDSPGTMVMAHK